MKGVFTVRNWFILFTTTFTITVLVLSAVTWLNHNMLPFDNRYVLAIGISSALLSLFLNVTSRLQRESILFTVITDILFIFIIVFTSTVIIGIHQINIRSAITIFLLVITIYIIITLIYLFLLRKEADNMNEKIKKWRTKNVDS